MRTRKPVIGVPADRRLLGSHWFHCVGEKYLAAIADAAEALPLIVPAFGDRLELEVLLERCDGVLLTGSPSNIEPARYGQPDAEDAAGPYDPGRDAMTADLIAAMLELGKPVIGICRGLQELNVAFGGTLRRDASRADELISHHAPDEAAFDAMFAHEHEVTLTPGGVLSRGFECASLRVNSVHYQAIDTLGAGLTVEAIAPDGVVEAVSARVGDAQVLAVQWHPEWRTDANPDSQAFFRLLGRVLRGEPVQSDERTPS